MMPKIPEKDQFWMVVRQNVPEGENSAPRVRHASYGAAKNEAKRLADKLGQPFVILWASSVQFPGEGK